MIRFKVTGKLDIEMVDENNPIDKKTITYPVQASGLGYSFQDFIIKNQLINSKIIEIFN